MVTKETIKSFVLNKIIIIWNIHANDRNFDIFW